MSSTTHQPEIIHLSEHQPPASLAQTIPPASLAQTITALQTRYKSAHTALYEALRDIYAAYHAYILNATQAEREKNRAVLDQACEANDIGTNDQTTDLHKLVKLVVTVNPQLTSGYVHVFSVARELHKTPDEFLGWLKEAGGIEAVRKKFLADGTLNPNYESGSKREKNRASRIANARNSLQAPRCTIDATALASANFTAVATPTECVAIVVRRPNGSVDIMDFVSDKALLNDAYLQHAIEQSEKTASNTTAPTDAMPPTPQEQEAVAAELADIGTA